MSNFKGETKILAIAGGFYYFGTEVEAPEGYVAITNAAMFRGFSGGNGLPGIAKGTSGQVTLDTFAKGEQLFFPLSAVYGILPSVDLYSVKGNTVNWD